MWGIFLLNIGDNPIQQPSQYGAESYVCVFISLCRCIFLTEINLGDDLTAYVPRSWD